MNFFLSKEGCRRWFILASDKNRKDHNWICEANLTSRLLPETGRSQSNEPWNKKQTKRIEIDQKRKPWPFELVQVNMCFLRGPLRWSTEQKNPKSAKRTARYNEFRYKEKKGGASICGECKTAMWFFKSLNTRFSFFTGCQKGAQEKMERKWQETSSKLREKS